MNKFKYFLLFYLAISQTVSAQIPTGSWREHLPYNNAKCLAILKDEVFCATPYSVFSYNQTEGVISKKSKIQGLSDMGIGYIASSEKHNSLIVGYLNGNLDVIKDGDRFNFAGIKEKNIMYDKSIKHILVHHDTAFISTGFGIVVFNLAKMEIADTYIIGPDGSYLTINGTIVFQNHLYALTPNGIKRAKLDDPFLSNYQQWELISGLPYGEQNYFTGAALNNTLLVAHKTDDTTLTPITAYNGTTWSTFLGDTIVNLQNMRSNTQMIWLNQDANIYVFNENLELVKTYDYSYNNDVMIQESGLLCLANRYSSLFIIKPDGYVNVYPKGPANAYNFEMKNIGNSLMVLPGGYGRMGHNSGFSVNVSNLTNETWSQLKATSNPVIDTLYDATCIASQNDPNHYFVGTWGFGIFEVVKNVVTNYYKPTQNGFDKPAYVSGMGFDSKGNLWTVHRNTEEPFKVKTKDNKWYSYTFGGYLSGKTTGKVLLAKNGDFWTISHRGDGILVWNDNLTPDNGADDKFKHFYALNENGDGFDRNYNSIAQDANGAIWIGTDNGVVVYDYPQNVLNGKTFYARQPQIVEDGYLQPLLKEKRVTSIAVDGANRKWLGTEGAGLFMVSSDGTNELSSYNQSSSPLFSDNIQSLCFNNYNGELFIGTDQGLQSYMTTSSAPRSTFSEVYAFPNPVRPDYAGFITIRGLMYQSNVKIVDLSGHLVFETISEGGDAVWNGLDMEGDKVSSGIYTVLLNNTDGTQSEVTKILIVR